MADIEPVDALVLRGTGSPTVDGIAGVTIVPGDVLYIDATASDKLKLAINTSLAASTAVGIALNGGALDQPIRYQTSGSIDLGVTTGQGISYAVSGNAGKIAENSDVVTGDYKTDLGTGSTTTLFTLNINVTGELIP